MHAGAVEMQAEVARLAAAVVAAHADFIKDEEGPEGPCEKHKSFNQVRRCWQQYWPPAVAHALMESCACSFCRTSVCVRAGNQPCKTLTRRAPAEAAQHPPTAQTTLAGMLSSSIRRTGTAE